MLQLNTVECKNFRNKIGQYRVHMFDKADAQLSRQKTVKLNNAKIADYESEIEKLLNGSVKPIKKTVDERIAEINEQIVVLKKESEDAKATYIAHAEAEDKLISAGFETISEEFFNALNEYVSSSYTDEDENKFEQAVVKYFESNGAKNVKPEDIRIFTRQLGVKKGTTKSMCLTNKLNTSYNKKALKEVWLGIVADNFPIELPVYSWINKIEKKSKKNK